MNARRLPLFALPLVALPLVAGALMAVVIATPASAATESVAIADNSFSPSPVTITAGDTVEWTNGGSNPHNVTGDGLDSGSMAPGDDYSHTFASAGTFDYACTFHPGMDGRVVVRAAAATSGDVDVSDDELAQTGSSGTGATTGIAVAMVALGLWVIDMQRIRSARHRTR